MFILGTIPHSTIWGGGRLKALRGDIDFDRDIGHLYSVISRGSFDSFIVSGNRAGESFSEYFKRNRRRFGMGRFNSLPFSVALVDATLDLSIQVHPGAGTADLNGIEGKLESYYFLDAPISGSIYNGCNVSTVDEVRSLVESGCSECVAGSLPVEVGDYVTVLPGTLHALTAGSLVYEIEENFDVTYRLYDFLRRDPEGRARDLQIEEALSVLDPSLKSCVRKYSESWICERHYCTRFLSGADRYSNQTGTLNFFTLLAGNLVIDGVQASVGSTIVLEPNDGFELLGCSAIISRASDFSLEI